MSLRGVGVVYRWEGRKLLGQVRVGAALGACVLAPFALQLVLRLQSSTPQDTLFGRWVHTTGFATPLVVLSFCGQWVLPLLTALVAGDIFATEDHHGTWKTVLTRARSRTEIFLGKCLAALTFGVLATMMLAVASLAAGVALVGHQPLPDLSGGLLTAGPASRLVLLAWAEALIPVVGFTGVALLASVASRRSVVGVGVPVLVALLLQLLALVDGPAWAHGLLLSTPFDSWHGLFTRPRFTGPLVHGAVVSTGYAVVTTTVAWLLLRRRDIPVG